MSINLVNYALAKKDWKKAYEDLKVLEIGGRNLFTLSDWIGSISINTLEKFSGKFWAQRIYSQDWTSKKLLPNETYTIRFKAKLISKPSTTQINTWISAGFRLYEVGKGEMTIGDVTKEKYDAMEVGDEIEVVNTFTTPSNVHELAVLLYTARHTPGELAEVEFSEVKLEKGNRASDWTPAPEDINAHPFVAELAETVFRSKQNEERIRILENAITALGGGS